MPPILFGRIPRRLRRPLGHWVGRRRLGGTLGDWAGSRSLGGVGSGSIGGVGSWSIGGALRDWLPRRLAGRAVSAGISCGRRGCPSRLRHARPSLGRRRARRRRSIVPVTPEALLDPGQLRRRHLLSCAARAEEHAVLLEEAAARRERAHVEGAGVGRVVHPRPVSVSLPALLFGQAHPRTLRRFLFSQATRRPAVAISRGRPFRLGPPRRCPPSQEAGVGPSDATADGMQGRRRERDRRRREARPAHGRASP